MRLVTALALILATGCPVGGVKLNKDTAGGEDSAGTPCETPPRWYADADADGFGDLASSTVACEQPDGYLADSTDCDDTLASVSPAGLEVCNDLDDDCDGLVDSDDDSLDLTTLFEAFTDADHDGYGDPATAVTVCVLDDFQVADGTDCDDTLLAVNPSVTEVCNEIDDDCDGAVDEDLLLTGYDDADGDGYGDATTGVTACELPPGAITDGTDCDDADPTVNPGAVELCNGADDDCEGTIDEGALDTLPWYADADTDGYGDAASSTTACDAPPGYVDDNTDCDDTDPAVNPAASELCNGLDDDCDGTVDTDASDRSTWYADSDSDGYGDPTSSTTACDAPAGYITDASDCDDANPAVNPAATEVCNGLDDDCNGTVDTDAADLSTWYADNDSDGYGDATSTTTACDAPADYVSDDTDCDDTDSAVNPGALEVCGGLDLDCDGADPELCTSCADALADGYTTDGLYTIDVDGSGGALTDVEVWCDQSTDGGGWTLIQRTVWDWTETSLLLTGYGDWYTADVGSAAPAQAFRLAGANWSTVGAGGEMLAMHANRDSTSLADCDPLYYTASGGTLTVSSSTASFTSLAGTVSLTNVDELSTTDSGPSTACVNDYDGVPWFYSTCCTTCPSFKSDYWSDEAHPMASYTDSNADLYGQLASDVCPSGAALPNENGGGYEGINVMEIYLR